MTFTEAAIEVLRREGKPLHFGKIAEIAIRENLLDHVGKVPEETLAGQLAAHCRLPSADRRVIAVQPGTFALVEWGLEEDPAGLDGLVEAPPEQELPYRSRERHPVPSRELARAGRDGREREGRGRRREEEERRGRKFPPPAEVAYEILAGTAHPLALAEIAAQGAERLLMPDAFVRDVASLRAALSEDNRRRESSGRKAMFEIDGDTVTLVARPEPGERAATPAPVARAASTPQELRRAGLAAFRRRLRECDGPTLEHLAAKLLDALGFRELKVAKRGREHVVYTARRRMGLGDVRHGIRILRGGGDVARREVGDLRRDLGHYGAQIGMILSAGDAARDARGDAGAAGQLPVVLYCGEALAEAFVDAGLGCVPVVIPDVDEEFFRAAAEAAEQEEASRRARREERERREPREGGREGREPREGREGGERRREERGGPDTEEAERTETDVMEPRAEAAGPAIVELDLQSPRPLAEAEASADEAEGEGDEDGPDDETAEPGAKEAGAEGAAEGAEGERRRRRRRRRRRGGRGRGRESGAAGTGEGSAGGPSAAAAAPGAPQAGAPPSGEGASQGGAPAEAAAAPEPSAPSAPPASSGGEGGS